jgi:hypothetical protein
MTTATKEKKKTEMVEEVTKGMRFHATIGDCTHEWETVKALGEGAWECLGINNPVEVGGENRDSEYAGKKHKFFEETILGSVNLGRVWDDRNNRDTAFLAEQSIGNVLHRFISANRFIRYKVVSVSKGVKGYKAIALVGDWNPHDLPHWSPLGNIEMGYEARQVREGAVATKIQHDTLFEHPNFGWKDKRYAVKTPTKMKEIDLSDPKKPDNLDETARLWALRSQVSKALERTDSDGGEDAFASETPRKYLQRAFDLLKKELVKDEPKELPVGLNEKQVKALMLACGTMTEIRPTLARNNERKKAGDPNPALYTDEELATFDESMAILKAMVIPPTANGAPPKKKTAKKK